MKTELDRVQTGDVLEAFWGSGAGDELRHLLDVLKDRHMARLVNMPVDVKASYLWFEQGVIHGLEVVGYEIVQCVEASKKAREKASKNAKENPAAAAELQRLVNENAGNPKGPGL